MCGKLNFIFFCSILVIIYYIDLLYMCITTLMNENIRTILISAKDKWINGDLTNISNMIRLKNNLITSNEKRNTVVSKTIAKYTLQELKDRIKTDNDLRIKVMSQEYLLPNTKAVLGRYLLDETYTFKYDADLKTNLRPNFDINNDVIIFLHIQKTGGMHYNTRIEKELQVPFKCNFDVKITTSTVKCLNPSNNMWFYNTAYAGWQCGVHADWTQMHKCIPSKLDVIERKQRPRRYFYFTQLRDAVERYLSEYNHVYIGGHWECNLGCGDVINAENTDIKPCYNGKNWFKVSLDKFIACDSNLAIQRMTRMLADLTLAGCYTNFTNADTIKRRAGIWLESAKTNLQTMEYIGLMEDEAASDRLFTKTYNLKFLKVLKSMNSNHRGGKTIYMTEEQFLKILKVTELDIHLYLFGKDLFYDRLH